MVVEQSPITQLVESVKKSVRMKGVQVGFGAAALAEAGSAPAVTIVPTVESYETPENDGNLLDAPLSLAVHCWGKNFDQARGLRNRVLLAFFDFQKQTDLLRLAAEGGTWDTSSDTEQDGIEVVVRVVVRDCVERDEEVTGEIEELDFQPAP